MISRQIGCINTADSSCLIKLGKTSLLCGIKAHVAEPDLAHFRTGYIVPNLDLSPMSSSSVKPGPPSELAQVISYQLSSLLNK